MDIHSYLTDLIARRETEAKAKKAADDERAAKAEVDRLAGWSEFWAGIEPLIPDVLKPYLVKESSANSVGYYASAKFEAPGLAPIKINYRFDNGCWTLTNDLRNLFSVEMYEVKHPDHDEGYHVGTDRWTSFSKLDDALLDALRSEDVRKQLVLDAEQRNAERLADLAEHRAAEARQEQRQQAEADAYAVDVARKAAEIDAVVSIIKADPVAKALVTAFAALRDERREWQERLTAMEEGSESTEAYYERKLREARATAESAQREVRDERQRASDAEDERDALKKKQRRGM